MSNRVTIKEAAVELGMSEQGVRECMKRNLIDIGVVMPALNGSKQLSYHIYRDKLNRHLGKNE